MDVLRTIVVADDSAVVRRSVRRSLEQAGWIVCGEACNGREAIGKANEFHPQVVILDLSMPEMDGLEAARELKQTMPEIHLILFTMHGDVFRLNEAASAGFSAVFSKTDPIIAVVNKAESLLHAA
jgi:DNA-binding NarL/FixJ family response regulator